jgi:hypothetical protein
LGAVQLIFRLKEPHKNEPNYGCPLLRGEFPIRNSNPSTTVHELAGFLNELCELEPVE